MELVIGIVAGMLCHEYAHVLAAEHEGDSTPRRLGRATWNPFSHLDPLWSLVVPLCSFVLTGMPLGAGQPVPLSPETLPTLGARLRVVLAGPAANLIVAGGFALAGMTGAATINLVLCAFNLVPMPPLDGYEAARLILEERRKS